MRVSFFILFLLASVTANGQLIFNRTFYGPPGSNQGAFSSTVDDAGNIYRVGFYRYNTPFDWLALMKLDSAGNLLWSKANDLARSGRKIKKLSDGNLILLGEILESSPPTNRKSTLLCKTDTAGNTLWCRVYFDSIGFYANDVIELPDKGFALTGGLSDIFNQQEDKIFLMRTDSVGNVLWCKLYGNGYPGYYSRSVVTTHDGGFIVGGNMVDVEDIVVFRTDSLGNLIWSKQFGGTKGDFLQSLISLSNGNYAFGGYSNSFIGSGSWPPFAYLLLQFDSSGNTVFCRQYPTGQSEHCNAISETHDGGIVINGNIAKIKVDLFGNIIWKNAAGAGIDVFTMNNGNILFTGTPGILPVIKADSLGNLGCNQGILFIPQMVSLSENLLPMNFYESAFSPSDSVVSVSLSNIQLTSTLNCLTATGTEDHFSEDAVTIFPNPFVSELFIKNNSFNSLSHISLINMFGQVVFSKKLDAADFDPLILNWLPAGIYCMNLFFTDRNHSVSKKLIKVE